MAANSANTLKRLIGLRTTTRIMDGVTFTTATGGTNVALVTIQPNFGRVGITAIVGVRNLTMYLSDSTTGYGLTATTASGNVNTQTAGTTGTDIGTLTTKKAFIIQTNSTGQYTLSITDTAKTAFNVCVAGPDGHTYVFPMTAAMYG